jgi:hypothetical protein
VKAARVGLVVALAGVGGFLLWAATGGGGGGTSAPQAPPSTPTAAPSPAAPGVPAGPVAGAGMQFSSPAQCKACHADVWEEWATSMHSKAWTDPEVRSLSDNFKSTECLPCHVPQPIYSAPVGGRVFERSSRYESGVDCLSCHLLPDGGVAASRDIPGAPCRPRKVETLREPVSCKGCHNQHALVDEWETLFHAPDASRGAVMGSGRPESCIDCHMAPVTRRAAGGAPERKGFDHVFRGGYYEEVLKRGVTFAARIEAGALVADTTNSGTGHRAPADSRHRSFNVWVTVVTAGGVKVHDRTEIAEYRMYYRNQFRDNTNLRPGETATARFPLPQGIKGRIVAELVYCLNPVKKERREAKPVHRVELEFDTTSPR